MDHYKVVHTVPEENIRRLLEVVPQNLVSAPQRDTRNLLGFKVVSDAVVGLLQSGRNDLVEPVVIFRNDVDGRLDIALLHLVEESCGHCRELAVRLIHPV